MAFGFYTPFPVAHAKVPSDQSNFAVYVPINDARFKTVANGGHVQNANFYDGRWYNDNGPTTALSYELVPGTYNATTGVAEVWVKQNITAAVDAPLYCFYGDASLTTDGSNTSTWNSNFAVVLHLPNGSSLTSNDSTGNANNAATINAATAVSGKIDGAATFDGSSAYIQGFSAAWPSSGAMAAWFRCTSASNLRRTILSFVDTVTVATTEIYVDGVSNSGKLAAQQTGNSVTVIGTADLRDSAWHRALFVYGTAAQVTQSAVYLDNAAAVNVTNATGSMTVNNKTCSIGDESTGSNGQLHARFFAGDIDEVRVYVTPPSADWITCEWNNQNSPTTFAVMGTEVTIGGTVKVPTRLFQRIVN